MDEGIGSATPPSPSLSPPVARSAPPTAEPEHPATEASQQKRWPDLDAPEGHTERFASMPSPASAAIPESPSPPADSVTSETGANPAATELLPPPAPPDAAKTAPTVVSEKPEIFPEISMWSGGAAKDSQPEPVRSSSDLLEDKTERLDDVLAKLRQQSAGEPLPPLKQPQASQSFASAIPLQPVRQVESVPASHRTDDRAPGAPPKSGKRLFVYGEPPRPAAEPPPVRPRAAAAAVSAPVPDATGRRIRGIGIGLIVAAIVVLFAAILWVLISLLRGAAAGDTRRSSHAGLTGPVAAAAPGSVHP